MIFSIRIFRSANAIQEDWKPIQMDSSDISLLQKGSFES